MEVFGDDRSRPYRLGQVFSLPTATGGVPVIAVSAKDARYLLSGYTFLIILIFAALWRIYVNLVMRFYPSPSMSRRNRYVAIAGIGSAGDVWATAYLMTKYCWTMFFKARDSRSGALAVKVLVAAVLLGTTRIAAGITVPSIIFVDDFAPVDASFIFLPPRLNLFEIDPSMVFFRTIVQNSAQLAVSYLANVQDTLLEPGPNQRVSVNFTDLPPASWGRSIRVDYSYQVTGVDFGLQFAGDLSKTVRGTCTTVSRVLNGTDWQGINGFGHVEIAPVGLTVASPFSYQGEELRYLIFLNATGMRSLGYSDDPWYATGGLVVEGGERTFTVLPDRPFLSCQQLETWSYRGHQVTGNTSITQLPGLKLKPVLMEYLENPLNRLSPIILMPLLLGNRMMLSAFTSIGNVFDASLCSIQDEMKRLVALSFVFERDILRRTITNNPMRTKYKNLALVNGTKADGVDDFVLRSSGVATISLRALVAIPTILLIIGLVLLILENCTCGQKSGSQYRARRTAFMPMQMYRHIDESVVGNHIWKGRTSRVPYVTGNGLQEDLLAEEETTGPYNQFLSKSGTILEGDTCREKVSGSVVPGVVDR